jgi:hypothetical protein
MKIEKELYTKLFEEFKNVTRHYQSSFPSYSFDSRMFMSMTKYMIKTNSLSPFNVTGLFNSYLEQVKYVKRIINYYFFQNTEKSHLIDKGLMKKVEK